MPYELERKNCPLELKAADAANGLIVGYASTFEPGENHDCYGDVFDPGAFTETLKLSGPTADDPTIVMLWEHHKGFGIPQEMLTDDIGLMTKGKPSATTKNADRMVLVEDKVVRGLSLGYYAREWESLEALTPWGEKVRNILVADIEEYSVVRRPGNPNAQILDVKSVETWKRQDDGIWVPDPTNRTLAAVKTTETLAGKVLSAKSRGLVVSAMDALEGLKAPLQALLDASDEKKSAEVDVGQVQTDTPPEGAPDTLNVQALSSLRARAQLLQANLELISMT